MTGAPGRGAHVVVVGGGIAGLAAAWDLATQPEGGGRRVTVLEKAGRLGGKIATEPFAGIPLDTGPDAFLARTSAAIDLCREVGLGDDLVAPGTGVAYVWSRRQLRRLPAGLVLGVPTDLWALARSGILSPLGLARAGLDLVLPRSRRHGDDLSVADLIRARLGTELLERLVDPLVGGINAGRSEELSVAVAAPQLAAAARARSLIAGARAARRAAADAAAPAGGGPATIAPPVFFTVRGGMARLVDAVGSALASRPGITLCVGEGAVALERRGDGWTVTTSQRRRLDADAVVIATPAPPAAELLRDTCPGAADELGRIAYSSVALVTMSYQSAAVSQPLDGSGFLVPRVEGRLMTACSWVNAKWPHLTPDGLTVVRVSAGRAGDRRAFQMADDELVGRLHGELAEAMGISGPPVEARVHRWAQAFPQFAPGHLNRVAAIDAHLSSTAPGVALAGAAYGGVGLPTCISSGHAAARRVMAALPVSAATERAEMEGKGWPA